MAEHTDTSPEALRADLQRLRELDRPELVERASGPAADFEAHLADLGWRLAVADPTPTLRSPSGALYDLDEDDGTLSHWAWRARAETIADNPELLAAAERTWPDYLTAATQTLGAPDGLHAWSDADFPQVYPWPADEHRRRERSPLRLARWDLPGGALLLWVNVFSGTATDRRPGTVAVVVTALLPAGA